MSELPARWQQKPNESGEAYRRRVAPYLRHSAELAQEDWQAHRAQVAATPSGIGLEDSPAARAAAVGNRGFGSGRELEKRGGVTDGVHVPGSVGIGLVYASQLSADDKPLVRSPAAVLRSTGEGFIGVDR